MKLTKNAQQGDDEIHEEHTTKGQYITRENK
jgi:hypothetical protein